MKLTGKKQSKAGSIRDAGFPHMNKTDPYFPKDKICPWCLSQKVHEPNSMAILNGGALLMSEDRESGGMDPRLDGFLSLIWHGAHGVGEGAHRGVFKMLRMADNCRGGQFEIYFCSTQCLRAYLNYSVDELEKMIGESESLESEAGGDAGADLK
jgi:hypothetical protein